ncbi:prepilin-type N-terminal cleavage/methylation domain-containing protein [Vibrio fortis]|jgi:type II secretory pathway pseudopilin PulG|uniref:prepilin-type N-terminal cleavage/methylation domain-containing protein n=1 Tax=Vibrio fortis TaxID=212667 RepID=UPI0021C42A3B|nr:prepilin-type N-terminal cleavage/methylation domain-containing protein [Vibrio fortis]
MKHKSLSNGFTLLELIIIIVIIGAIAAVAAPRFLSIADDARSASSSTLLENFQTAVNIYQAACLARGGDVEEGRDENATDFNIEGIYSNYTGSCYPVWNSASGIQRTINNNRSCYWLLQDLTNSDHYEDNRYGNSPKEGGSTSRTPSFSNFQLAKQNGYKFLINQPTGEFSYCHFYSIEGDLSQAPFLLYNAVDGEMVTGITDLSNGIDYDEELKKYTVATKP